MRHAAAGNPLTLETATSGSHLLTHHHSPPSNKHCHSSELSTSGCNGAERWADGPAQPSPAQLLTWLDAREWSATLTHTLTLSARAGNSERIRYPTIPHHTLVRGPKLPQRTRTVTAAVIRSAG